MYTILFLFKMFRYSEVSWDQNIKQADYGDRIFDINLTEIGFFIQWGKYKAARNFDYEDFK